MRRRFNKSERKRLGEQVKLLQRGIVPRTISKAVRRAAYTRADGHCEHCGCALVAGAIRYDHVIPHSLGGTSTLGNCAVLCRNCHDLKTTQRDIPTIAKAVRIADKIRSALPPGKPLPGGRGSKFKRTISGAVVPRVSQSEAHRELMARRYGTIDDDL